MGGWMSAAPTTWSRPCAARRQTLVPQMRIVPRGRRTSAQRAEHILCRKLVGRGDQGSPARAARTLLRFDEAARWLRTPAGVSVRRSEYFGSPVLATVAPGTYDPIRFSIC